jgi:hypothetical protein
VSDVLGVIPPWAVAAVIAFGCFVVYKMGPWTWTGGVAGMLGGAYLKWPTPAVAALAVLGGLLFYLVDCLKDPYADCWYCGGSPKRRNRQRNFHNCPVCGGKGKRLRVGAVRERVRQAGD